MKTLLFSFLALAPAAAWAQSQQCTQQNSILVGTYAMTGSGTRGGTPFAALARIVYDGLGGLQLTVSGSVNGAILQGSTGSGTYTVNRDCTGTQVFGSGPGAAHFDLLVSPDGKQILLLQTDAGTTVTAIATRLDH
jgi:hypothetical protein